jgi:hypothetical protein
VEPHMMDPKEIQSIRGVGKYVLYGLDGIFWWMEKHSIKLDLILEDQVVGHQVYVPACSPKYITCGQKGIHATSIPCDGYPGRTVPVLIFEGMFDYLTTQQCLLSLEENIGPWELVYVAGNNISNEQLLEIQSRYPSNTHEYFICFDNDKIHPPLRAKQRLELISTKRGRVHLLLPPTEDWKDWDEVLINAPTMIRYIMESVA